MPPSAPAVNRDASGAGPSLTRSLSAMDGALLTVGAVVGTGIFLAAGDVARALPHPGLLMSAWVAGGALTLAGALTYAEMGAMLPRAGGLYHFLREAWGPMPGFLYGWTCLLVIMSGGIAAIAVGFGEYLGALVPAFASERDAWRLDVAGAEWRVSGAQLAGALGILGFTAVNHFGVRFGANVQNAFTLTKLAAIAALVLFGMAVPATAVPAWSTPVPANPAALLAPFGVALIAVLWTFDGWYAFTFAAGEARNPARAIPLGLLLGTAVILAVYLALNWVYLRALSPAELGGTTRAAEAAATALFGRNGGRLMTGAVAVSAFGCLSATVLYASRIYQPMAVDGVFFRFVASIHPRWRTPVPALWLQGAWATVLALTGGYTALFIYTTFGGVLFHVAGGLALFRLRRTRPDANRPYRAWGHPLTPALFVLGMLLLTISTLVAAPRESLLGLIVIAAGFPAYRWWRTRAKGG